MAGPRPYDSTVKIVTDIADADERVYLDPASVQALPPVTSTTNGLMTPAMLATLGSESVVTRTQIYAEAHGFVQDGVTDESVAFNALLAAAPAGSEIVVTGMIGVKAATISVPSRVSIRGLDRRLHGFKLLNAANLDAVVAQAGWLATTPTPTADLPMGTISDLLINGNSTNQVSGAGHGLVVFSSYADIARVDIYYPGGDGLRVTSQRRDGTEISNNAVQQHISRVTVTHAGAHGIHIHDPDPSVDTNVVDGWIEDCIVDTCVLNGIHLDSAGGWLMDGNHLYVCAMNGILAGRANYTRIVNNEIEPFGASATAGSYAGISLGDGSTSFIGAINPSLIEGNTIVYGGGAAAGSFIAGIRCVQSNGSKGDVVIGVNGLRGAHHVLNTRGIELKCQGATAEMRAVVTRQFYVGWDIDRVVNRNSGIITVASDNLSSDVVVGDTGAVKPFINHGLSANTAPLAIVGETNAAYVTISAPAASHCSSLAHVCKLADGRILAAWRGGAGAASEGFGKASVVLALSSDKGATWTAESAIYTDGTYDSRAPAVAQLLDGRISLTFTLNTVNATDTVHEGTSQVMYCTSGADPLTPGNWTAPTRLTNSGDTAVIGGGDNTISPIVEVSAGNFVVPMQASSTSTTLAGGTWACGYIYSTNNGVSWSNFVQLQSSATLFQELHMVVCANGDWFMTIRDQTNKKIRYQRLVAGTGGLTGSGSWTAIADLTTAIYSSPRIMKMADGTLLIMARYSATTNPGQAGIIASSDNGATWTGPLVVDNRGGQVWWDYGGIVEIDPGILLAVYSTFSSIANPGYGEVIGRYFSKSVAGVTPLGTHFVRGLVSTDGDIGVTNGLIRFGRYAFGILASDPASTTFHDGDYYLNAVPLQVGARRKIGGYNNGNLGTPGMLPILTDVDRSPSAALSESYPRERGDEDMGAGTLVSGTLYVVYMPLTAGQTIATINFWSGDTAGAGLTHCWVARFFSTTPFGNAAKSTDNTAATWAANTKRSFTISTGLIGGTGMIPFGLVVVGTTPPSLRGAPGGIVQMEAPITSGDANTGLTTPGAFSANLATITASRGIPYATLT